MNDKIAQAINLAFRKHNDQYRKGTNFPYIIHPLNVMRYLMMEMADDNCITDEVIIAGILHDLVEDTDITLDEINDIFGAEVERLVNSASEPEVLKKNKDQKGTWHDRKLFTIKHLRFLDKPTKLLSCCDKLDNARSMNEDFLFNGEKLWKRFNASKDDIFWYYKECLNSYKTGISIEKNRCYLLLNNEVELLCLK